MTRSSSPRPQPPQQGQAECLICGRTVRPGARLWCSSHRGGWPCMCGQRGGVTVQGWHAAQPEVKGRCGWTDTCGTAASLYLQEGAGSPLLSPCLSPLGRPCVRQRFWEDCTRPGHAGGAGQLTTAQPLTSQRPAILLVTTHTSSNLTQLLAPQAFQTTKGWFISKIWPETD